MPEEIRRLLSRLNEAGFSAYVVGGCVRDSLMGRIPEDYDICTAATPDQIKACFSEYETIDIGKDHGTIAVVLSEGPVEITTFRVDGEYLDGRHPETVRFTDRIEEDLARRDFTVNAMAFHPETGLVDPFGGRRDIAGRRLACVGQGEQRFGEDGLRIMRGLRFAAVLDFDIDEETENAMARCAPCLAKVAKERTCREFAKLILGKAADRVLEKYGEILSAALPGFCARTVGTLPNHLETRLAAVFPVDTENCLRRLKFSGRTAETAGAITRLTAENPPLDKVGIKKLLSREESAVALAYCDMRGCRKEAEGIIASGACFRLRDLAAGGEDLISAGIPEGKAVGDSLSLLLELVMEEKLANDKDTLIAYLLSEREEKDEY